MFVSFSRMVNHTVFFVVLTLLLVNYASSVDPGESISVSGITLNTSLILRKIESALNNYDRTYGRSIHDKVDGGCLDSNFHGHDQDYIVYPSRNCISDSATQQWRLNGNRIEVAAQKFFPNIQGFPSLHCYNNELDCDVIVNSRNSNENQAFFIRVHPVQFDFANKRVFFAIHNTKYADRCLTRFYKEYHQAIMFHLQECNGRNEQSFYLDLDLSKEVDEVHSKLAHFLEEDEVEEDDGEEEEQFN